MPHQVLQRLLIYSSPSHISTIRMPTRMWSNQLSTTRHGVSLYLTGAYQKSYGFSLSYHVTSPNKSYFPCNTCTKNLWVIFGLFLPHKCLPTIDFTDFLRSSSKSAVADEKYFNHLFISP